MNENVNDDGTRGNAKENYTMDPLLLHVGIQINNYIRVCVLGTMDV